MNLNGKDRFRNPETPPFPFPYFNKDANKMPDDKSV